MFVAQQDRFKMFAFCLFYMLEGELLGIIDWPAEFCLRRENNVTRCSQLRGKKSIVRYSEVDKEDDSW